MATQWHYSSTSATVARWRWGWRVLKRGDTLTGDFFPGLKATPLPPLGSMDYRGEVALLVSKLLKDYAANAAHPLTGTRYEFAARVSELTDVETSKLVLDSYTSVAREDCNLPLWKVPAMDCVASARELSEWPVLKLGGRVLWGSDIVDAEIVRAQAEMDQLREEIRSLKQMKKRAANG